MATDLGKKPGKSAGAKHDAFVLAQLARAEKRIRALDLAAALFGFAAICCVFLVLAALCDRAWSLSAWLRQLSLGGFLLGSAAYLYVTLARPLLYRVNPYYAAQHVEQTMPSAKNSVINWLDLQQEKLPPAIRAAVVQKAAKDLSRADIDQAFNTRRLLWTGGAAAACAAGLLACFVWLGGEAFSQFQRVLTPFSFSSTPRTTITITRPVNGDETVTIRRPVTIEARVEGKIPDPQSPSAVKLFYRYQENEPYLERLMRPDGSDFMASIAAEDVHDGFLYKVAAGDVETPEYRIGVRSTPLLTSVQATYHFRPYVAREDEEHYGRSPFKLSAWRGTEITLLVHTNRPVKDAYFVIEDKDGKQSFPAEKVENDPLAFRVKHILDKTARYRLEYTTPDDENYADPIFQEMVAVPDLPPQPVVIAVPGRDSQLPCNGLLQVEGAATDDIGVQSMTLRMQVAKVGELSGKPYRADTGLRLKSGGFPLTVAYKDYVDLKTVQMPGNVRVALQPGMELEYWLEARDACDYPKPNVSESKHYRVKLLPPEKDAEKLKDQHDQAKREQNQHEAKQNEALNKEDKARQDEKQRHKEDSEQEKASVEGNKSPENAPKEQQANPSNNAANPDPKKSEETSNTKQKLEQAIKDRQNEQNNGDKGQAKSDPKEPAGKPKGDGSPEQRPPSESKPDAKPDERQQTAADKPASPKSDPRNAPSEAKPENKSDPMQPSSVNKPEPASRPDTPHESKADAKDQPKSEPKSPPTPQQMKEAAQQKPESKNTDPMCTKGECKKGSENPDGKPSLEKKEVTTPTDKSAGKNAGDSQPGDDQKGQPKSGGNPAGSAENKPAPQKPERETVAKADPKEDKEPGNGSQAPQIDPKNAKPDDVSKLSHDLSPSDFNRDRKQAAQNLDQIAKEAKDPKTREMAEKELEKAGLKPTSPSENKPPPEDKKGDGNSEKVCAAKGDKGMKPGETGTPKSSEPQKQQVPPSDNKNLGQPQIDEQPSQADDPAQREEMRKKREEDLKKLEEMRKSGQFDEKALQDFLKAKGYKASPPDVAANKEKPPFVPEENLLGKDQEPLTPPKKPTDDKATMLQLRKLQDAVDKKTLEKAGITPEQWQKFLKDYADQAKRQDPTASETLPAPQNTGKLSGIGNTRTNPGAASNPNDPRSTDRVKLPPGYDDSWKLFTQKRSSSTENK